MSDTEKKSGVVLVVGRNGQVGSELVRRAGAFGLASEGLGSGDFDITSLRSIQGKVAELKPSLIINAAAYTAVDKAESEPGAAYSLNALAPGLLAQAANKAGIPLLHISTDYVYDGNKAGAYIEGDPINPLGVYGRTKAEGDAAVAEQAERHIILRTSWVFGPHGNNFVKTMARLGAERLELRVVDDQRGRPTAAGDIAVALLTIAAKYLERADEGFPWGVYHFANSPTTNWFGFATTIMEELAARGRKSAKVLPIPSRDYPTAAQRPMNSELDCAKIEQVFGIAPGPWISPLRDMLDGM
jgi:dTDP-4-dehydrorhamnose reductase